MTVIELFQLTMIPAHLLANEHVMVRICARLMGTEFSFLDLLTYAVGIALHLSRGFFECVKGREDWRSAVDGHYRSGSLSAISGGLQYSQRQAHVRLILRGRPPICRSVAPRPRPESRRSAFR